MNAKIREPFSDRLFVYTIYFILCLILVAVIYPLIYIVSSSVSDPQDVIAGNVWLFPVNPTLVAYKAVLSNSQIMTGFLNSIFYSIAGTTICVCMTIMLGYPLSKKTLAGRHYIMFFLVLTLLFEGGLIPLYLTVKNLGLLNTRWAMLLPGALTVWQVIVVRTFFQSTIPAELSDAAEIDGCSDIHFLLKVVIPLSKPIIAVLVLQYAAGIWNSYFDGMIYLNDAKLFPLQVILRNILILNQFDPTMMKDVQEMMKNQNMTTLLKYALIIVSSGPVLLIYPFIQKYFVKGIMIGSLKG
ncbi:carbohydrate ABC transporter permease [Paenibacillus alginolyticus]|uniref:carbohydrate ABC transporter permease n=1 Tax=Paenibacillus alginolyticus TaxID=59839 RepID=UPI0003F78202|nr:carbohydrate ABC transporter permease [Paenibacillus alginolyticus]MCY9669997.1 carbohydrate ABC transporter permease [Paenibacillus alginolyticus]